MRPACGPARRESNAAGARRTSTGSARADKLQQTGGSPNRVVARRPAGKIGPRLSPHRRREAVPTSGTAAGVRPAARAAGAGAVPRAQLPVPVARRSADLVRLRDGDADPRLVRAGRDRVSRDADPVRRAAACGHSGGADVRRRRRPGRPPQRALRHARRVHGARGEPHGLCLRRRPHPDGGARHDRADGPRAPVRPWRPHGAGRGQRARRGPGGGDGRFAHHLGLRSRRRRHHRSGHLCSLRHGAGLYRGRHAATQSACC